jgi:hypothetical protein
MTADTKPLSQRDAVHPPRRFKTGVDRVLSFAAAPAFAVMALLTGLEDGGMRGLCSAANAASPLTGMVPMYLLMSVVHAAPWLRLISTRRRQARQAAASRHAAGSARFGVRRGPP